MIKINGSNVIIKVVKLSLPLLNHHAYKLVQFRPLYLVYAQTASVLARLRFHSLALEKLLKRLLQILLTVNRLPTLPQFRLLPPNLLLARYASLRPVFPSIAVKLRLRTTVRRTLRLSLDTQRYLVFPYLANRLLLYPFYLGLKIYR